MLNRLTLDGRDYSLVKLPDGFKIGDRPYVMLMGGQVFIMEAVSDETDLKKQERPDEKIEKKIIFKTNDGVEYFEGQESDGLCGLNIATWGTTVAMVRFALTDYNNDWVFFSSKLQLANYIRKKKPTISYDDVIMFLDAIKMEIPAQHLASFIKMIESKL